MNNAIRKITELSEEEVTNRGLWTYGFFTGMAFGFAVGIFYAKK